MGAGRTLEEWWTLLRSDDPVIVRRHLELHRERLEERLAEQVRTLGRLERQLDPAPAHG